MIRLNKTAIHANTVNSRKYMIFFWNPQLFLNEIATQKVTDTIVAIFDLAISS